jgi:hypothetical protein
MEGREHPAVLDRLDRVGDAMKTFLGTVALSASLSLALAPAVAHPQEDPEGWAAAPADQAAEQDDDDQVAYPAEPVASPQEASAQGQWVQTEQYGRIWMPYADGYVRVPDDGEPPRMYVYGPSIGWSWVIAPWIWGWGPSPFFGRLGCDHFGWWGHGYGRWDGFRGDRLGFGGRGVWRGSGWVGVRSLAPQRSWAGAPQRGWAGAPQRGWSGAPQRAHGWSGGGWSGGSPQRSWDRGAPQRGWTGGGRSGAGWSGGTRGASRAVSHGSSHRSSGGGQHRSRPR